MSRLNFMPVLTEYSFRQRGNAIIIRLDLVLRESLKILSESEHWGAFLRKKLEHTRCLTYLPTYNERYIVLFYLLIMR